jgi:lipopolysaccharide biosynthesis protein
MPNDGWSGNSGVIVDRSGSSESPWVNCAAAGLRLAALCVRRIYVWLMMHAHFLASLRRTRATFVTARHVGADRLIDGAKIAVFAHYDPAGVVHDFVTYYLQALRDAGFAIVFVSNCPDLAMASLQRVLSLSALVLLRANVGYDFGAFKDGIGELGELSRFQQVVLANDSVYGPLFDLREVLARCDAGADVWGMTDSRDGGYHLQSYFLLFRDRALADPGLKTFFGSVRPVQSKDWVIRRYEIGLTQAMRRAGLRCAALFPYEEAAAAFVRTVVTSEAARRSGTSEPNRRYSAQMLRMLARGAPLNATHFFWIELVSKLRCPFIKRELLIDNPAGAPHVSGWRDIIGSVSTYETELAARHMRTFRCRADRVGNTGQLRQAGGGDLRRAAR